MTNIPDWLRQYEEESTQSEQPDRDPGRCSLTGGDCPTEERQIARCRQC